MSDPVTHCWPSGNSNPPTTLQPAGPLIGSTIAAIGTLQGVAVWLHGGNVATITQVFPPVITDVVVGFGLNVRALTLANALAALGWATIGPTLPGDGYQIGGGIQLIYDDIAADSGHGSRSMSTNLAWWDHIVWRVQTTLGVSTKIVPVGMSYGGYLALLIAAHRTSTIAAYVAHHPASILSDINPVFSPDVTFSDTTTTGADATSSILNSVTGVPGLVGWGSIDEAIGPSPWSTDGLTPVIYSTAKGAGAEVSPNCDGTGSSSAGTGAGQIQENHTLTSSSDNANPYNDVSQITTWWTANLPTV